MREKFSLPEYVVILAMALDPGTSLATELPADLMADRAAVELVYHRHRTGDKRPFEQVLTQSVLTQMVERDLFRQEVLRRVYGVEIEAAAIEAEARRIDDATKAPEVLAEIKAALGNDRARFCRTVVLPALVDRVLLQKFDDDPRIHGPGREIMTKVRAGLVECASKGAGAAELAARMRASGTGGCEPFEWRLGQAREEAQAEAAGHPPAFGSGPQADGERRSPWFEDMPAQLKEPLRRSLVRPGNISPLIDLPEAYRIFLLEEITPERMRGLVLTSRKCSFDQWLEQQRGQSTTTHNQAAPAISDQSQPQQPSKP